MFLTRESISRFSVKMNHALVSLSSFLSFGLFPAYETQERASDHFIENFLNVRFATRADETHRRICVGTRHDTNHLQLAPLSIKNVCFRSHAFLVVKIHLHTCRPFVFSVPFAYCICTSSKMPRLMLFLKASMRLKGITGCV